MLSRNVPKEELKKYDIKVIRNLSVERNFQEHLYNKREPLSATATTSRSVFLQTTFQHINSVPDIQMLFLGTNKEDFLNGPAEFLR
ncbi:unnamed protein product [Heterotrigona itama]|uniref:Uncharacterized protein n=1 Tax=Heterotrigona itama TaxID=395501 RepID=A0A6V7HJ46_9HYME|nr:unnamed protein product [Heterotrigona itama]